MTLERATFQRVQQLLRTQGGIVVDDGKEYLVEARLAPLLSQHHVKRIEELVERMDSDVEVKTKILEAMTTNETSFFRDHRPFDILRTDIIPELVKKRGTRRTLEIWSAACSSGQEPYSIAILLREHFPALSTWRIHIYATDISTGILNRAKSANYSQLEVNRGLSAVQLVKHFDRAGLHWEIKPELRAMVEFAPLNLVGHWPAMPTFDIVFLRNVLIYFDTKTKGSVLHRVGGQLAPDGYMMLGGGENLLEIDSPFERVSFERASCYRLTESKPKAAAFTRPIQG